MAEITTRGGLIKPGDGESADNDVLNANFDQIAKYGMGAFECTSTARPAQPWFGQLIAETDTDFVRMWDGEQWKYIGGDSRAEFTGSGTPTSGAVWGNALTLDVPSSVSGPSRPAAVAGAGSLAEVINIPEVGNYLLEGIVIASAVTTSRAYIEIFGGTTTGMENSYGRVPFTFDDRGHIGVKMHTTAPNFKASIRYFVTNGGLTVNSRFKITRDAG